MKNHKTFGLKTDFERNFAVRSNLGSLLKEDIKLLSKKSFSKNKIKKLAILDNINEEEKNDGFYDKFLNVLYNDEMENGRGSFSNHKKQKKMNFHKRISAGHLDFNQIKFHEIIMNKNNSPERNIVKKKNNHHMGTTFEAKIEEEINNNGLKSDKSIKLNDDDKSEEMNIENLKSLDYSKKNIKMTELMKNDNNEFEINLNSNREQTTKNDNKDFLENKLNSNFIIFNDNKLDDDKKENKNECNSNKDKGFIIDVKKKKKFFFCCLPIFN